MASPYPSISHSMTPEDLKQVSKIMEQLDRDRTFPVSVHKEKELTPEMISLIERTYKENGRLVSLKEVTEADQKVKKNLLPKQGVDYIVQGENGAVKKSRWMRKFRVDGVPLDFKMAPLSSKMEVMQALLEIATKTRPYSDQDREDYLKREVDFANRWFSPQSLLVMAAGLGVSIAGLTALWNPTVPFFNASLSSLMYFTWGVVCLVGIPSSLVNWWTPRKRFAAIRKGDREAVQKFHEEYAYTFNRTLSRRPSVELIQKHFGGLFIPSEIFVWNKESYSLVQKMQKDETLKKIIDFWNEEGVPWRQQDFWLLLLLAGYLGVVPLYEISTI